MTKPNVYIVDDTEEVRSSLNFLLQGAGYASRAFATGSEFLTDLLELPPGCVLLDFQMPGLSGLEVLWELRWMEVEWPVVMMTGHGDANLATTALSHGAIDFLDKPFDEASLMQILDRAFSSGKMARKAQRPAARLSEG